MRLAKRIVQVTTRVLSGFAILISLLLGVMYWQSCSVKVDYRQFSLLESDDGAHLLRIDTAEPVTPYGHQRVNITVVEAASRDVIVEKNTRLSNDGARIDESNISGQWVDTDTVSVCIRGDEQKDAIISIDVRTRIVSEKQQPC